MELHSLVAPVWVDTVSTLRSLIEPLESQSVLAIDTESNNLYVYYEQVCLLQISTYESDYLIDPITLPGLKSLSRVFASPKIEKVFHAAEYDLICLKRDFDFEFSNLFDTMLAGRILGLDKLGLASMLKIEFGVELDKKYQRSNWGKRPLSAEQLDYARLDTHYLIALRDILKERLIKADRWELAMEDFQRLCDVHVPDSLNGTKTCKRINGLNSLASYQVNVLNELCKYREKEAQKANLPPYKIMGKQTLLNIARACPVHKSELPIVPKLSSRQIERFGCGIVEAVQEGLNNPTEYHRGNGFKRDDHFTSRYENLRVWRRQKGLAVGVESDVILPKDILEDIARSNPSSLSELSVVMETVPWRFDRYGKEIIGLIKS